MKLITINNAGELFKKLWVKIVVELVIAGLMMAIFFIFKRLVPKKYRITNSHIKRILESITKASANLPKNDDNVLSIINKSFHICNGIFSEKSSMFQSFIDVYAKQNDLKLYYDGIFINNFLDKLLTEAENVSVVQNVNGRCNLHCANFGDGREFYFGKKLGETEAHSDSYEYFFCTTKNFNYKNLVELLFKKYNNRVLVDMFANGTINLTEIDFSKTHDGFIPDENTIKLEREIKKFLQFKISRNYIFYGVPGAGKSSMAIEISKRITSKVLKLTSASLIGVGSDSIKMLITASNADVIIIDDLDRIFMKDISPLLTALESIKNLPNHPILIATANNLSRMDPALLRPGRFDEIIEFPDISDEQRKNFIEKISKNLDVSLDENSVNQLIKATKGLSKAFIKEFCCQFKLGLTTNQVLAKIKNRRKYLNLNIDVVETEEENNDDDL